MNRRLLLLLVAPLLLGIFAASWAGDRDQALVIMTHDSFAVSKDLIAAFEKENKVSLKFLKSGDAGVALNQAILSKENPLADVFYGVDNTFLTRGLNADIFNPYDSPLLSEIPDHLKLDPQNRLLPVDFGDVCLNYDKKWFTTKGLAPPAGLEDLIKPEYKDLTVVEHPATSSPGLAFMLATIGRFGETGYLDYWQKLKDSGVLVVSGWKEAYYGQFSASSKGRRPIVVSYATSPPAEVHFAGQPLTEAPTAAVTSDGSCFRQIEFVGILKGTKNLTLAKKFVDFMLSKKFQEDVPLNMFVFPANKNAVLPEVFTKFTQVPAKSILIPAADIGAKREKWIEAWAKVVLK